MAIFPKNLLILSRRHFLVVALGLTLTACGKDSIIQSAVDSMRLAWKGAPDVTINREQIAKMPYASIYAKTGKGQRSLLILGRYDHDDRHWISADRGVLVTRKGRLVKTVGFPVDLKQTLDIGNDPVAKGLHNISMEKTYMRLVDIIPINHFQVPIRSRFQRLGEETIEILGIRFDTIVVKETSEAPTLEWKFENTYWADPDTGFIWRSIQHYAPKLPPMEIDVLKPAT